MFQMYVDRGDNILYLEPSAGIGNIADGVCEEIGETPDSINMHLVEVDTFKAEILKNKGYKHVYNQDFMEFNPGPIYDHIFMNPPFSIEGHPMAWAEHVLHAYKLLLPGYGKLMAVVPISVRSGSRPGAKAVRGLYNYHEFELPQESFKSSGTNASTILIYAETL